MVTREKIDIFLTKEWRKQSLTSFVNQLKKNDVLVNKIYYISSRTSRFVDNFVLETSTKTLNPFIILGDKISFLRSSTEVRIYPHLSQLFIKLMYPENSKLKKMDLTKILWLVKKRIYRGQEFGVLKLPEPIAVFVNVKKMYLTDIMERLSLPMRLLL